MTSIRNSRSAVFTGLALVLFAVLALAVSGKDPSVDELKTRVFNAPVGDRPALCIHISELQLDAASKLYGEGSDENAAAKLSDVESFAGLARDYAIQSHKHEKQSEIAVRRMIRKLSDIRHLVGHDEQKPIQDAIDGLQRVRDDLLLAMFPKGKTK